MKALALPLAVAALFLAVGCGDDGETTSTGAGGAKSDADARDAAVAAWLTIESYANGNADSYAGASPDELAKIEPSLSSADLEVVSTDSSFTVSVLSESGTTFSIAGGGGSPDRTCDPPGGPGCTEGGDWE